MCTRYSLTTPADAVRTYFKIGGTAGETAFPPRYNIAPSQPVVIVRQESGRPRELVLVRWGLIPSWVKDPRDYATLVNARAESAAGKPSFRGPLRHRRCLVPADGYYEWNGPARARQPYLFRPRDLAARPLLALAGLWDHWLGADGSEIETMAVLTTKATGPAARIHERMPVIIAPEDFDAWLDCSPGSTVTVEDLLRPPPEGLLERRPVSSLTNNSRNEGSDLWAPGGDAVIAKLI